ncbi:hypothetical protein BDP27DRAFT_1317942 [Rhodocollybia butyracea]|uniref:Xylosidase/arabinosidase n=1 Tax=Rhodocollybia butyracea TaxID=206335 RepID=A0A9P5UBF9_9AGAR|nr:hypothetical protein BDP27DRAFT_1317942 [Rhodocollybia butyracea]
MDSSRVLKRADPSSIQDKFLVGYQGWFTCPGDGEPIDPGHHGWLHWLNQPISDGGRPHTDLWPDVSEYSPSELYPVPGINFHSGEPATLFSSRNPKTVQRHFHWMARHGVDGVFLQRFLGQCDLEGGSKGIPRLRDEVTDRVQEAAEKEGRVFAIMYDVSGVDPDKVMKIFTRDWVHLIYEKRILDSPNYLKERGMPVIGLWGFGFKNRNHTPDLVKNITRFIRDVTPGGAYLMAGTATHWRRSVEDADPNPAFLDVWLNEFDAISPWMVGRLTNEDHVDMYAEHYMKADVELLKKSHEEGNRKIDYIPVVYPGFSGLNLTEGKWEFNQIKRNGGKFLWQQIFNAKRLGLRVMYGYDEGTALMPVIEKSRLLPHSEKYTFMALDADGYDLPADWYMRICGFAAEGLRSERMIHETFPSKELQDYWSTRPRYEEVSNKSGDFVSGSQGGEGGQSFQHWLDAQQKGKDDDAPPPPYSLEVAEPAASSSRDAASTTSQNLPADAAVTSITADLSRQSISSAPAPSASSSSASSATRPQPPLHPSRVSSSSSNRVSSPPVSTPPVHPSRTTRPPEPNLLSRPQSLSVSRPQTQQPPQLTAGRTSSPQRPSADWNSGPNRPASSASYRPHPASPPHASRPITPFDSQNGRNHPFGSGESTSFPQANVLSGPPNSTTTSYPPQQSYHSQQASYTPPGGPPPGHPSSSFHAGSYGPTSSQSQPPIPYLSRPSPQSQPSSYFPTPPHSPPPEKRGAYSPPPSQPYQMPGYPPSQSTYSHPSSSPYNDAGPWAPPHPMNSTSPPLPLQSQYPQAYGGYPNSYQQMPGPSSSTTSTSSSSLTNYARNAVDKVAGRDTVQQLENKLGSLAHGSSKLLGKFTKF